MPASEWTVEFYIDKRGRSPVEEYLAALPEDERASVARTIALVRMFGPALGMPHARPVGNGLWELRASAQRIFYVGYVGRRFVLLHAYRKKSQQTPRSEIATALRRWNELTEG